MASAHHERRTSEPPSMDDSAASRRDSLQRHMSEDNLSPSKPPPHRRGMTQVPEGIPSSTRSLPMTHTVSSSSSGGSHHSRASSQTSVDLSMFHDSWSNTDGGAFFGGTTPTAGTTGLPPQHHPLLPSGGPPSKRSASFGGFGGTTTTAPVMTLPTALSRSVSTASAAAKTGPKLDVYGVSSVIHDAARITDWDRVLQLCAQQPDAASYAGRDGWTALHHACNRRCPRPDVVQALIHAYPEALLQEEEKAWLPLHYACRFKAPKEVVRLLLHLYPDSGRLAVESRDRQGRRPLYYAVRYDAPKGVAGLLLAVDPSAVLEEDQNDESPLALIWDSWAEKLEGKRIVHSFLPGGFPEPEETTLEERAVLLRRRLVREPKLRKRWQQVNMLLKAAFGFPFEDDDGDEYDEDNSNSSSPRDNLAASTHSTASSTMNNNKEGRKWRIVHATAAVKCHLSLFLLACALHPEQAKELDQNDLRRPDANGVVRPATASSHQTALHLAASSNAGGEPGMKVVVSLLSLYREAAQLQDGIDGSLPLHLMVENPKKQDWPIHSAILYHFYPRAVQITDFNNKLPLHRATAAITHADREGDQERSVIVQLVRSFPQAASHVDSTGCVPFHYLAMNAAVWDDESDALHNTNRGAIQMRAGPVWHGRQPIHMAAASTKSRESLIQRLVQLHPRGSSLEDRTGKLPLHLACEQGKEWSHGTRCICEAFPTAVRQTESNARGWLPLHMVAACPTATAALIAKIVELYPAAADIPDNQGRFPLHLACSSGKRWLGGLKALFDASPVAIATCDNKGLLPLHICSLSYCRKEDSHKAVTRAVPKVQKEKESAIKKQEAAEMDIIFNLLRADPTTLLPQSAAEEED